MLLVLALMVKSQGLGVWVHTSAVAGATDVYVCEREQDVTGNEQLCTANPPLVNRG